MAISSYKAFLMKGSGTSSITYAKLVDITDFGDIGGDVESIDVTTLSDGARVFIPGIQNNEAITFTANYSATDYSTLSALADTETNYAIWFGASTSGGAATPTGSAGKFSFKGYLSVKVNGAGVNEAVQMNISILPSTGITFAST